MYAQSSDFRSASDWKAYSAEIHNPAVIKVQFYRTASASLQKSYNTADDLIPDE